MNISQIGLCVSQNIKYGINLRGLLIISASGTMGCSYMLVLLAFADILKLSLTR